MYRVNQIGKETTTCELNENQTPITLILTILVKTDSERHLKTKEGKEIKDLLFKIKWIRRKYT